MISYLDLKDYLSLDKLIIYSLLLWIAHAAYKLYSTKDEPPMVPHIPIIGHTLQLRNNPRQFLLECQKKYGDVFGVNFLGKKVLVFANKASEYLTKAHDMDVYGGRDKILFLTEVLGESKDSPGKPDQILDNVAIINQVITPMLKTMLPEVLKVMNKIIQEEIGEGTGPEGINIEFFFSNVIANSVAILLLGPELSKDNDLIFLLRDYSNKVDGCLKKGLLWHLVPFIGSYIVGYKIKNGNPSVKERQFIYSRIEKYIQNRRQRIKAGEKVEAKGLVDALSDKGHTISQISHAIMIIGFASISTTTRNSSLLIADLLAHPENFSVLREEQKRITEHVVKDKTGSPLLSKEDIDKFENLNSAIRETLRHRSHHLDSWRLTNIERVLPNGMKIPKGSLMAFDLPSIHFNPGSYGNGDKMLKIDPFVPLELQYNPFQFVESKLKASKVTQNFLNFGMGRHACPGRFFAVQEIISLVSTLLQKYRIETRDGKRKEFYTGDFGIPDPYVIFRPLT